MDKHIYATIASEPTNQKVRSMNTPRRSAPTGIPADEENWKPDAPPKKPAKDPVAAEREYLDELRPKKIGR